MSSTLRICCISDLHGFLPEIQPCDLLLIAGDVCPFASYEPADQRAWLSGEFTRWKSSLPAGRIIWTAGNHDFALVDAAYRATLDCTVDAEKEIAGLRIWCSPWSVEFDEWAFMETEAGLAKRYAAIPGGIDIIVSHCPPLGLGDRTSTGDFAGSQSLRKRIEEINPRLVVFGHIHEGYGRYQLGSTELLNVAIRNGLSQPMNLPVYVEMDVS